MSSFLYYHTVLRVIHSALVCLLTRIKFLLSFHLQVFSFVKAGLTKVCIYIYLVSINLKGLPMPSGDLNRIIERERERGGGTRE